MSARRLRYTPEAHTATPAFRYRVYGHALHANQPIAGLAAGVDGPGPGPTLTLHVTHAAAARVPVTAARDVVFEHTVAHSSGRPMLRISRLRDEGAHFLEHGSGLACRIDSRARSMTIAWPERLTEDPWEFVLGFASAYMLKCLGVVCLHAAVVVNGEALLLAGPPGAGKSTLAAALLTRGCRLVTDDVAALRAEGGEMYVQPGPATLRPRASAVDTLRALNGGASMWTPSAEPGCVDIDPLAMNAYAGGDAVRVAAVCFLRPFDGHQGVVLERLESAEATVALIGDSWGTQVADAAMRANELDQISRLIAQTGAVCLTYDPADGVWPIDAMSVLAAREPRLVFASES